MKREKEDEDSCLLFSYKKFLRDKPLINWAHALVSFFFLFWAEQDQSLDHLGLRIALVNLLKKNVGVP